MWTGFVPLLLLALTPCAVPATTNVHCGDPKVLPSTTRIVNGNEAKPGAWPWVVLLMELNKPVCAGAILSDNIILTAAHCFDDPVSRDMRRWQVLAGKHHTDSYDSTQRTYYIKKLLVHEKYDEIAVINDIAILVLRQTIQFTDSIHPICLPSPNEVLLVGQNCYLAGWGDTLGTGKDTVLNQVMLPVLSDSTCSRPDWYGSEFVPETMLCAGYETGMKDACSGDSGSPLVCKHNGYWFAQGIASWGYGCAEPKWPGLYTEVTKYVPWILDKATRLGHPIG